MSKSVFLVFVGFCIFLSRVESYQNAYDLLEQRRAQKRFYLPQSRNFYTSESFLSYDDRNRHFDHDRHPYMVYTTKRPYVSDFGNGYDNLGNGIPTSHFQPFRQRLRQSHDDWRYQRPFQQFHNGFRFDGYTPSSYSHRQDNYYQPRRYYPKYDDRSTITRREYGNEYGSKGSLDVGKTDRFFEDNEDKKQKKTDEIFQQSQEGITMGSERKEKAGEESHTDRTGENKSSIRTNKVVKKGHMTRGFATHHHKDETGNTTTYFDESSDFGGQSDFKDVADGFGIRKSLEQFTNTGDEKFYKEHGGQSGNYGSGLSLGNQKFEKDYSSSDRHSEAGSKYHQGNDDGVLKTYQYLNGEKFDFNQPSPDIYY